MDEVGIGMGEGLVDNMLLGNPTREIILGLTTSEQSLSYDWRPVSDFGFVVGNYVVRHDPVKRNWYVVETRKHEVVTSENCLPLFFDDRKAAEDWASVYSREYSASCPGPPSQLVDIFSSQTRAYQNAERDVLMAFMLIL
jgi:hypothetical protein